MKFEEFVEKYEEDLAVMEGLTQRMNRLEKGLEMITEILEKKYSEEETELIPEDDEEETNDIMVEEPVIEDDEKTDDIVVEEPVIEDDEENDKEEDEEVILQDEPEKPHYEKHSKNFKFSDYSENKSFKEKAKEFKKFF